MGKHLKNQPEGWHGSTAAGVVLLPTPMLLLQDHAAIAARHQSCCKCCH